MLSFKDALLLSAPPAFVVKSTLSKLFPQLAFTELFLELAGSFSRELAPRAAEDQRDMLAYEVQHEEPALGNARFSKASPPPVSLSTFVCGDVFTCHSQRHCPCGKAGVQQTGSTG